MFCERKYDDDVAVPAGRPGLAWPPVPASPSLVNSDRRRCVGRSRWNEDRRRFETSLAPQSPRNGAKVLLGRRSLSLPLSSTCVCLSVCLSVCLHGGEIGGSEEQKAPRFSSSDAGTTGQDKADLRRPAGSTQQSALRGALSEFGCSLSRSLSLPIDLWLWLLSARRSRCSGFAIRSGVAARLVWDGERWDGAVQW